ncbi:LysM peptidoglycan-binding domain-containing protein [Garicola koreensis]|uniref:LysM repeat protein n=1 Tax=Garicola koreensis TaxID=1262554 RepID=A0A7W5TUS0_9MICC|nr:LysM peptidoglycan-binding domain-containing protein [Garicola koreensis]MBB3667664.1 LysM repeat protein [Garicola koreensis]
MTTTNSATAHTGTPVTLTRRGRLVLLGLPVLLAVAAVLAGLLLASASLFNQAQASTAEQPGVSAVEVAVDPGDTLWSLAQDAPTDDDVREVMAAITELNNLDSSQLQPGEVLHVPAD